MVVPGFDIDELEMSEYQLSALFPSAPPGQHWQSHYFLLQTAGYSPSMDKSLLVMSCLQPCIFNKKGKPSDCQVLHLEIIMFYLSVQIPIKSRSESFSLLFREVYTNLTFMSEKVSNNQVVKIAGLGYFSYRRMKPLYRY